jgi:hypothetical protein
MNIYLDIDGVILTKDGKQMPGLEQFLNKIFGISGGNVYWLTTHCRELSTERVMLYIKDKLDSDIYKILESVKPVIWDTLKTEGIDFNNEFLWFDDYILQVELRILREHNCENSWIKVENSLDINF